MEIAFIIQARLGSSRLPGKILLPFYKQLSLLDLLLEKLSNVTSVGVVVATSVSPENDRIEEITKRHHSICYRGSELDVLDRFIAAAELVGATKIIRICSDNPFLELASIQKMIDFARNDNGEADYIGYDIMGTPSIRTHYGFWGEYVKFQALKKVASLTDESIYHEHVTNYIYEHPDIFCIKWLPGPSCLVGCENIRLTIDTEEDFNVAKTIYNELVQTTIHPTIQQIVNYLEIHPKYYRSMKNQIIKNTK